MIGSRAQVGEQVHCGVRSRVQQVNRTVTVDLAKRTLNIGDRTRPSGESQNTDSIETGTVNLTLHKRTSR